VEILYNEYSNLAYCTRSESHEVKWSATAVVELQSICWTARFL